MNTLKIGDLVKFNLRFKENFIRETTSEDINVQKYQQLVLNGINEVGIIKEIGKDMTFVSFTDGWKLPIPTKYLELVSGQS